MLDFNYISRRKARFPLYGIFYAPTASKFASFRVNIHFAISYPCAYPVKSAHTYIRLQSSAAVRIRSQLCSFGLLHPAELRLITPCLVANFMPTGGQADKPTANPMPTVVNLLTNNIIPHYNKKRKVFGVNMKKNISDRIQLGKTDIWVSPVGCGVLPMGPGQLALPVDEGAELICYALSKGINFIDTAQYYRTYPYIRRALEMLENRLADVCSACASANSVPADDASGKSVASSVPCAGKAGKLAASSVPCAMFERPVISSKTLASDYESAYAAILEECAALSVPYIDIFLLHEVRSGQFAMREGAWRALMAAKAEGLVRAIGASTHHVDVVEELTTVAECDVIFPLINYAGMGIRRGRSAASCADMAAAIDAARGTGKGIYAMKALGGGNLAAHYREALDYVFGLDSIDSVMLGFGCRRDIDDIASYLDGSMPQDYVPDVSAKRVRVNQEDCEGCGTCLAVCHSAAITYNKNGLAEIDQSKCITCGYCAQACPVRAIIMF